jgi:hypothetical protein
LVREQKKRATRKAPARRAAPAAEEAAPKKPATSRRRTTSAAAPVPEAGHESAANEPVAAQEANDTPADSRRPDAIDIIASTLEALATERGGDKIYGSMIKQAIKRVRPSFNESYYGFRSFNAMLEAARDANVLALERDEKSGGYIVRLVADDE